MDGHIRLCFSVLIGMSPLLAAGCGQRARQTTPGQLVTATAGVPLHGWAPKNPSPDFLRAAKVLKPMPSEKVGGFVGAAQAARLVRTYPAAWEFFGTLTDEQIHHFLTSRPVSMPGEESQASTRVLIPVKSLAPRQRAALDKYFDEWRRAMSGTYRADDPRAFGFADRLVALYRFGAKEDLSNVDAGFNVAGHSVNITFRIRMPDGTVRSGFGCTIVGL
jgi:hypothetical protein